MDQEPVQIDDGKKKKPLKMTQDVVKKLEEIFAMDGSVEEACFWADISKQSYYNWIKDWPKLKDRFDALRNKPMLKARMSLMKGLDDPEFALKYAERKNRKEFALRQEHTGADGEPITGIQIEIVTKSNGNEKAKIEVDGGIPEELPKPDENNGERGGQSVEQDGQLGAVDVM